MKGLVGFARAVGGTRTVGAAPTSLQLQKLVELVFWASLRAEEGRAIRCLITCRSTVGAPLQFIQWPRSALSPRAIAKAALATDPRSASLVVEYQTVAPAGWYLIGMIDRLPTQPVGAFQIAIEGTAHLSLSRGGQKLAEFHAGQVYATAADVLRRGPIAGKLGWSNSQATLFADLLSRVDRQGHGGAFVVVPNGTMPSQVTLAYQSTPTAYGGLAAAIHRRSGSSAREQALWVVASMSRVDGAVLVDRSLNVLGHGARLSATPAPDVRLATRTDGKHAHLWKSLNQWGTRHGSMIAFCRATPDAVGFVISEDGGVRAVTLLPQSGVTMWERIRLNGSDLRPAVP